MYTDEELLADIKQAFEMRSAMWARDAEIIATEGASNTFLRRYNKWEFDEAINRIHLKWHKAREELNAGNIGQICSDRY